MGNGPHEHSFMNVDEDLRVPVQYTLENVW